VTIIALLNSWCANADGGALSWSTINSISSRDGMHRVGWKRGKTPLSSFTHDTLRAHWFFFYVYIYLISCVWARRDLQARAWLGSSSGITRAGPFFLHNRDTCLCGTNAFNLLGLLQRKDNSQPWTRPPMNIPPLLIKISLTAFFTRVFLSMGILQKTRNCWKVTA